VKEGSEERRGMKVFSLLRMGMTWSFFALLEAMVGEVFPLLRVRPLFFLLLLLVIVEEKLVGDLLIRYREEKIQRWREAGILIVIFYLGFSLFQVGILQERFIPNVSLVYRVVLLFLGWLVSAQFREGTRFLYLLYRAIGDRRGERLTQYLREESFFIREVRANLKMVRGRASLFLISLGALLFLYYLLGYELGGIYLIIFFFLVVQVLLFRSRIHHVYEELRLFSEGLRIPEEEQQKILIYLMVVLPGIVLLLHILTSLAGVVPPEVIESFFWWFSSLFKDTGSNFVLPESWQRSTETSLPKMEEILREFDVTPAPFWNHFWKIVEWTAIVGGGIAILVLLFGPLFSRRFRAFLSRIDGFGIFLSLKKVWQRVSRGVVRFLGGLLFGVGKLLGALREGLRGTRRGLDRSSAAGGEAKEERSRSREEEEAERELLRRKRGETRRISRGMKRVFRWAKGKGLVRRPGETLEEYFIRVAARIEGNGEFFVLREIFEESRFSKLPVGHSKKVRFFRAVRSLVRR
jgi:hypothetical protein